MFIKESLGDILKPKNLTGKYFYSPNRFVGRPVFIFEILAVTSGEIICEVVHNEFLNTGPDEFEFPVGTEFTLMYDDLSSGRFLELDQKPIEEIENKILELNKFKVFLEGLLNE